MTVEGFAGGHPHAIAPDCPRVSLEGAPGPKCVVGVRTRLEEVDGFAYTSVLLRAVCVDRSAGAVLA